jgi:hypothetical protein
MQDPISERDAADAKEICIEVSKLLDAYREHYHHPNHKKMIAGELRRFQRYPILPQLVGNLVSQIEEDCEDDPDEDVMKGFLRMLDQLSDHKYPPAPDDGEGERVGSRLETLLTQERATVSQRKWNQRAPIPYIQMFRAIPLLRYESGNDLQVPVHHPWTHRTPSMTGSEVCRKTPFENCSRSSTRPVSLLRRQPHLPLCPFRPGLHRLMHLCRLQSLLLSFYFLYFYVQTVDRSC